MARTKKKNNNRRSSLVGPLPRRRRTTTTTMMMTSSTTRMNFFLVVSSLLCYCWCCNLVLQPAYVSAFSLSTVVARRRTTTTTTYPSDSSSTIRIVQEEEPPPPPLVIKAVPLTTTPPSDSSSSTQQKQQKEETTMLATTTTTTVQDDDVASDTPSRPQQQESEEVSAPANLMTKEEASTTTTTTTIDPLARGIEIASILFNTVLGPASSTLLEKGLPVDGDEFFARRTTTSNTNNTATLAERVVQAAERLGPTFVKFGQALSARSDIVPPVLAEALSRLQDDMAESFDTATAKEMIRRELLIEKGVDAAIVNGLIETMVEDPVGAASIAQVYKAEHPTYGPVAIKIQRPGVRELVQQDTSMLLTTAEFLESLPALPTMKQDRLVATKLVDSVGEFMSRVTEELDYHTETSNMEKFASLYSHTVGSCENVNVIVPEVLQDLCTDNIIVMEWIEGTKVTEFQAGDGSLEENLEILESASAATLTQLFTTGVLHADPHDGNLLKVRMDDGRVMLGYLDYGMVSSIPEHVRDALVCAVAQMVFARNVEKVVLLFAELDLIKQEKLDDPTERAALTSAMNTIMDEVMVFPESPGSDGTVIPDLSFDSLLGGLSLLVSRFEFQLPPYFINNARALATLEGITKKLNPDRKTMNSVYPVALDRIFSNPSQSPVVEATLLDLVKDPSTGVATVQRAMQLLDDSARLSGKTRRKVLKDIMMTKGGKRMMRKIGLEIMRGKLSGSRKASRPRYNARRPYFML